MKALARRYCNVERVLAGKGLVALCGRRPDARGLAEVELIAGAQRSTMDELANAALSTDKVLAF